MNIFHLLSRLGFSENESRVYLAALQTGTASAQQIALQANLKRTTVYSVLDYLVDRGLIGKTKVGQKTRFIAEAPEKLLVLADNIQHELKKALPELEAAYNTSGVKPKITFFEGNQAIHNVYEDTLKEMPAEILEWNTNAFFNRFPKNYNYIEKRVALGIKARRIAGKGSQWDTKHRPADKRELSETAIVPAERFDPQIEVNIYGNKVAFMNYAENMSIIIESKAIADSMRQAYELSWLGAKIKSPSI